MSSSIVICMDCEQEVQEYITYAGTNKSRCYDCCKKKHTDIAKNIKPENLARMIENIEKNLKKGMFKGADRIDTEIAIKAYKEVDQQNQAVDKVVKNLKEKKESGAKKEKKTKKKGGVKKS